MTTAAALVTDTPTTLLVATDLSTLVGAPGTPPGDVTIDGRAYRGLDATYYGWLRRRMEGARRAHGAGRVDEETWAHLRERFNAVHAWAVENLDPQALLAAATAATPEGFAPPVVADPPPPHRYPAEGEWRFEVDVPAAAVAEVERVRDEALAAGWWERELLQNRGHLRFPCGPDWGLVCFVGEDRTIGRVTPERVELVSRVPGRPPLGFYRRPLRRHDGADTSERAPVCVR